MDKTLIYTNERYAKRILEELLENFKYFIIVYQFTNHHGYKKIVIHNDEQMFRFNNQTIDYMDETEPLPKDVDFCFITIPVKSYSFKRLWLIQRQLTAMLTGTHELKNNYYIEGRYGTSVCINLYGPIKPFENSRVNQESLILLPSGFGDTFRYAYIIQKFIAERRKLGKEVTLLHNSPSSIKLSEILFKDCQNIYYGNFMRALEQCKEISYSKVFSMWDIDYIAKTRQKDISEYLLGYYEKDNFVSIDYNYTPRTVFQNIMALKSKKAIIGIQMNTAHHSDYYPRNYPYELAKEFVRICHQNQYAVVNLTGGYDLSVDIDCGDIDILGLPGIVKALDFVVTIDSFSGHLACCVNVPCIVLFNQVYAYSMEVLKNNFNMVSSVGDMHSIDPHIIFKYMVEILSGKISLPQSLREEYDVSDEKNMVRL